MTAPGCSGAGSPMAASLRTDSRARDRPWPAQAVTAQQRSPSPMRGGHADAAGSQERTIDRPFRRDDEARADVPVAGRRRRRAPRGARTSWPPPEPSPPLALSDEQLAANAAYEAAAAEAKKQAASALGDAKGGAEAGLLAARGRGRDVLLQHVPWVRWKVAGAGEQRPAHAQRGQAIALDIPSPGPKVDVAVERAFP